MAEAAVKVKRMQDRLTLKELIKEDPTDIFHHLLRANELVERIRLKVNNKDIDLSEYYLCIYEQRKILNDRDDSKRKATDKRLVIRRIKRFEGTFRETLPYYMH